MTQPEKLVLPPLPTVPESFVILPDNVAEQHELVDNFFVGVVDALGYTTPMAREMCEIRPRPILRPSDKGETNDMLTELIARDRVVASLLEIRTEFNYVQMMFALYVTEHNFEKLRYRSDESI